MKAFPNQIEMIDHVTYREVMKGGMELRDYFAAKAMQGISANSNIKNVSNEEFANACYELADAMMEARNDTA